MASAAPSRWLHLNIGLCLIALGIKLCLLDGYRSTDFEVHRNWLALTHSLPLSKWYFEATSIWTLDYPPFFAYFEWMLAKIAVKLVPEIVVISAQSVVSHNIVLFQRCSVMFTDLLLFWATARYLDGEEQEMIMLVQRKKENNAKSKIRNESTVPYKETTWKRLSVVFGLVILNAGLLLVDHIHFQYNGMLIGLLILCLDLARRKHYLGAAAAFSGLVLMKHLFVTLAPVFAVYFFRVHCFPPSHGSSSSLSQQQHSLKQVLWRFTQLLAIAALALSIAIVPFVWQEWHVIAALSPDRSTSISSIREATAMQLQQMLSRLLPFGRGLVHTYWAPNVWALYFALDRVLCVVLRKLHWVDLDPNVRSAVSGMLGDVKPSVLPNISASACLVLVLVTCLPALVVIYNRPNVNALTRAVVYCSMCAFMLGYHVHEKAVLVPMVVQTLLVDVSQTSKQTPVPATSTTAPTGACVGNTSAAYLLRVLAAAGIFGLFPLFTEPRELITKSVLYFLYMGALTHIREPRQMPPSNQSSRVAAVATQLPDWLVALVFSSLHVYNEYGHHLVAKWVGRPLEFFPLLLTSVVCAVFLIHAWLISLFQVLECVENDT